MLVVGVSAVEGQVGRYGLATGDLRLERFCPGERAREAPIRTVTLVQKPEELPRGAFGYLSYDLLLLAGDGLAELDTTQLQALLEWVRSGGSVCVIPGRGLQAPHLKFIRDLAAGNQDTPLFSIDEWGGVHADASFPESRIARYFTGVGRATNSCIFLRGVHGS